MCLISLSLAVLLQVNSASQTAASTITGVVVGQDNKAIPGAVVVLSGINHPGGKAPTQAKASTDSEGRFRIDVPRTTSKPGRQDRLILWGYRDGLAIAALALDPGSLPKDALRLTLVRAQPVTIKVVGPDGRAVENARAVVITTPATGVSYNVPIPSELADRLAVRTDHEGIAHLSGFSTQAFEYLQIDSGAYGSQSVSPSLAGNGVRTAVLAAVGRLRGKIVTGDPASAQGLRIRVYVNDNYPVGLAEATTDSSGRFDIPAIAAGKVRLYLVPKGGEAMRYLPPPAQEVVAGNTAEIEILLGSPANTRSVAGRVIDRQGKPVAGAVVRQSGDGPGRTQTTTDAAGRFTLEGVNEGPAFLFAQSPGFRFLGRLLGDKPGPVELVLTRTGEKPANPLTTQPSPLPHAAELDLARRVLDPYVAKVLKSGGLPEKIRMLEALARVEPERVLELAEKEKFPDPFFPEMFRLRVVEGLAYDDPDEAVSVTEAMQSSMTRAMGYVDISDAVPASATARARKLELLAQAVLHARNVKEPDKRLAVLGMVVDRWLDLGETEKATKLAREGQEIARQLPSAAWAGYARGAFAEELAQIDLPAALALTKDLSDPREFDRHHGNIAHELAGKNPAEAERILALVRDDRQRGSMSVRVCYRMAPVDLDRARTIAGKIGQPQLKAYALGVVSQSLARSDKTKPTAAALLAEAFDELTQQVESSKDTLNPMESAPVTAASLLPAAEAIDPGLLPEYLARSLALRRPSAAPEADPSQGWFLNQTTARLAMLLARYDHATARALLDPLVRRTASGAASQIDTIAQEVIVALGLIDPKGAVELLERLPEPASTELQQTKNDARLKLARMLSRTGDRRWGYLQWHYAYLWVPDLEDVVGEF